MAKTLIPKSIMLDEENIARIKKQFPFLTEGDISNIKHWNDPESPYSGTRIDKDAAFQAFPSYDPPEEFKGIIWE